MPRFQQGALVLTLFLPLSTQAGHASSHCLEIRDQKISVFFSPLLVSTDIWVGVDIKMNETGLCGQDI